DDDTLAELRTTGSERPLTITSASDPTELWFGEPPAQESPSSALVAWHERLLGRSVAGLIDEATDLTALDGRFARRLAGGARVITTQLGVAGDSGTDSLGHLLLLRGASRQRLLVDEATYEAVWTTRRMIRGVTAPTVNDGSGLMSYCLGIDTRELLPPVPPVARNGDGVFGLALRACRADYAGGWLPVTIRHEPVERRESSFAATLSGLTTLGPNDYLGRVIAALGAPKTADPAAAMRQLGATLQAMAESAGFAQDLHEIVVAGRSADRRRLEEVLAEHDHEPSHWAQDVRRAIMEVDASLSGGPPALPEVAEHVARYGRLLRLWPDVVAAARELRARGEGLGAASTGS
ncbi:MAG: hypothetical protein KC731_36405, partial [Myxococcales bacterium]|nr:hypothetical protein [Myxococcales bacterium]